MNANKVLLFLLFLILGACSHRELQKRDLQAQSATQNQQPDSSPTAPTAAIQPTHKTSATAPVTHESPAHEQVTENRDDESREKFKFKNKILDRVMATGESEGWVKIGTEEGITTYKKDIDQGDVAFRGEINIPTSILKIAGVLDNPKIRKEWIDALVDTKVVREHDRLHRVEYNHTAVPWPFQDRDFVYQVDIDVEKSPRSMNLKMKSVVDPQTPEISGVVRGALRYCNYYIAELEPEKLTRVVVEVALNPMGAVPKWLVNLNQKKWPQNTLAGLRRLSLKPDVLVPQDLEAYFKQGEKPHDQTEKKSSSKSTKAI